MTLFLVCWYLDQRRTYQPIDEAASWGILLACLCPILIYRNSLGRGLVFLSATGLILVNGYHSEAILEPPCRALGLPYESRFWNDIDLDLLVAALFPVTVAASKFFELRSRRLRCLHARRAIGVGVIWGTFLFSIRFQPWGDLVHYCLEITASVWLGAYLYHLCRSEYLLFTASRASSSLEQPLCEAGVSSL